MPQKDSTERDYRERVNRVIFHIEGHLDGALVLRDLAKVACFSPFHFHRIFSAFVGETASEPEIAKKMKPIVAGLLVRPQLSHKTRRHGISFDTHEISQVIPSKFELVID